ncbi:unnamed protein product [Ectocarpus sp. CCAP 1310/34]|nr:unnamed protein product [Ectocarpus sp. CCAP 1310/34]
MAHPGTVERPIIMASEKTTCMSTISLTAYKDISPAGNRLNKSVW